MTTARPGGNTDRITFSFGKNWSRYVRTVDAEKIANAQRNIAVHLGHDAIRGRSVLDVGSGSGIHSLALHRLGAKRVHSFDYDRHSVSATRELWSKEGRPTNWTVAHGSILDTQFVASLGQWDIVYSWGVLHHTGAMWQAVENAASLVGEGGRLWIALYVAGPRYAEDLRLKKQFNAAPEPVKWTIIGKQVLRQMYGRVRAGRSPLTWNSTTGPRGMSAYYDLWDWYGGLPYEVASHDEVGAFLGVRGFHEEKFVEAGEGACADYVFVRSG